MIKKQLVLTFWLMASMAFCQTSITDTIISSGVKRIYKLYIPAIYNPSTPVPLVFNFHGLGDMNTGQEKYGDLRPVADTANFIIVLPQGLLQAASSLTGWNNFSTVEAASKDLAFTSNMIDTIKSRYNIDMNRIYSTGMSNGGFMSYDIASFMSTRFAAIASVTGTMIELHKKASRPLHPIPVMQVHGTADNVVSYSGKGGILTSLNVDSLIKFWTNFNHCSPTPIKNTLADINTTDNCTVEHYVYSGGDMGTTVEFYKVINGGHTWPGTTVNNGFGNTDQDFNASKEIWRFFRQYSLDLLTDLPKTKSDFSENSISVYGNSKSRTIIVKSSSPIEKIFVYNLQGQRVKTVPGNGLLNQEFNLQDHGLFLLDITTKKNRVSKKVMM